MIKAGIIGCGKIADQHAANIQILKNCEIVGVCDSEELMAKQLADRFHIKNYFTDIKKLIEDVKPDVIHITTPPQSHFALGKLCLESGCNVYIEKPFTINLAEAQALVDLANAKNLKLTAGHNAQFSHAAMRMRELVQNGYLGGTPVHIDAYYCYDLSNERYAKALLGDKNHWVRKMPGQLLQNIISHGISKIAEFLTSDNPTIIAYGFNSQMLKKINETDIIDELRVIIHDNDFTTAYFTFSTQMKPVVKQLRIYGPKNSLIVDDESQTVIKVNGKKAKSYLEQFVTPLAISKQYASNAFYNIKKFIQRDFQTDAGMKYLIDKFYRSISGNGALPIPYKELLNTTRIMDAIFAQLQSKWWASLPK